MNLTEQYAVSHQALKGERELAMMRWGCGTASGFKTRSGVSLQDELKIRCAQARHDN
jgi:hypothetical protein